MKKFTKILSLIMILLVSLSLTACENFTMPNGGFMSNVKEKITKIMDKDKTEEISKTTNNISENTTSSEKKETTAAHTHSFVGDYFTSAEGHYQKCACGESQEVQKHTFGEWTTDTEATLTTKGSKHRVCTLCGYNDTVEIPELGTIETPVISVDQGDGAITLENKDKNASKYVYSVKRAENGTWTEWADVTEDLETLPFGYSLKVKGIAKDGYVDSTESEVVSRYYKNKVAENSYVGYLDNYKTNPAIITTYDSKTHVNHVKVLSTASDWASVVTPVIGNTTGYTVKVTITNVTTIDKGTSTEGIKLMLKWNNVEEGSKWSNYVVLDRTGRSAHFFKETWTPGEGAKGQVDLTNLVFGMTWNGVAPQEYEFDIIIKFEKITSSEEYSFNAETGKMQYEVKCSDPDYKQPVLIETPVETKTLAELLTMTSDHPDFTASGSNYFSKLYLVECYISELQTTGSKVEYGNGYLYDGDKLGLIYGLQPLNSSFVYKLNADKTQVSLDKFVSSKTFDTIVKDISVGDKVQLLVQVELYNGTTFQTLCEYVKTIEKASLQKEDAKESRVPSVDADSICTAVFDKETYKFGETVTVRFNISNPAFGVKEVSVTKQSKSTKVDATKVTLNEDGSYSFTCGTKDTISVTLESIYDTTAEVKKAIAEDESGYPEGTYYVKVTYTKKAGSTLEGDAPAPSYGLVEVKTVEELLTYQNTTNVTEKAAFIVKGYVRDYSNGCGKLYGYENSTQSMIDVYGCSKVNTWTYSYISSLTAKTAYGRDAASCAEVTNGKYVTLMAVYAVYNTKREVVCQFLEEEDYTLDINIATTYDSENYSPLFKKLSGTEEVALENVKIGDTVRIYPGTYDSATLECVVKVKDYQGVSTTLEMAEGKSYFEFTAKLGDSIEVIYEKSGYAQPVWELKNIDQTLYYVNIRYKLETNTDETAPASKIIAKYVVSEATIDDCLAVTGAYSIQLYIVEGFAFDVANTEYGNFNLYSFGETTKKIAVYGACIGTTGFGTVGFALKTAATETDYASKFNNPKTFKSGDSTVIVDGQFVKMLVMCVPYKGTPQISGYIIESDASKTIETSDIKFVPTFEIAGKAETDTTTTVGIKNAVTTGYTYGTTVELEYVLNTSVEIVSVSVERFDGTSDVLTAVEGVYSFTIELQDKVVFTVLDSSQIEKDYDGESVNSAFDFVYVKDTNFAEFEKWSSSYSTNTVTNGNVSVVFSSANKQSSTITDRPVTKGQPITIVVTNGDIQSFSMNFTQWGSKAQTITLSYSTDGGATYTTAKTSTDFSISYDFSKVKGNVTNLKITFSSSSNQIGVANATLTYNAKKVEE